MNHDYTPNLLSDKVMIKEVPKDLDGVRLDKVLAMLFPYSRARLSQWLKEARILIDGKAMIAGKKSVAAGTRVSLQLPALSDASSDEAENIALEVVFGDDDLLVVNKPDRLVVHPANGHASGTLYNAILYHHPAASNLPRAGIVHRLDKDTTGLMVVAKNLMAHACLVQQLKARKITRIYWALAWGQTPSEGVIDAAIGRHPKERIKMAAVPYGKPAKTYFRVVQRYKACTLLQCQLETGRTHQIRVHLASLGHPVVGDPLYGKRRCDLPLLRDFPRQALHAKELSLAHPREDTVCHWFAPLPEDFSDLLSGMA
jgi:23S rRNA pseudouridine1911/1915/1917 synthase